MRHEAIRSAPGVRIWLSRRRLLGAVSGALAAGALLVAALAVLLGYFVLFYALVSVIFRQGNSLAEAPRAATSFVLVALLFVENWRERRRTKPAEPTGSALADEITKRAPQGFRESATRPGAAGPSRTFRAAAAALLLAGPRLVTAAFERRARAWRLFRMDVQSCARLLDLVHDRAGRVSFEELAGEIGDTDTVKALAQLADLEGVMFHVSAPPGVSLSDDLRGAIAAAIAGASGVNPG